MLFLKITRFRRILGLIVRQKMLSIQVNGKGLFVGGVRLSLEANDMLLYADPTKAPGNPGPSCYSFAIFGRGAIGE